jgi:hypothetical protein
MALYFGTSTAAYVLARALGSNHLSWADCAFYPWRRESIRQRQGQALTAQGLEALHAGAFGRSGALLTAALSKDPNLWQARAALASILFESGARERALAILKEGVPLSASEPDYMAVTMNLVVRAGDSAVFLDFAEAALKTAGESADAEHRRWLKRRQIEALIWEKRAPEALTLLESLSGEHPEDVLLFAKAKLATDEPAAAAARIEDWMAREKGYLDARLLDILVLAHREVGDLRGMEKSLALQIQQDPAAITPRVALLVQRLLAGDRKGAQEALESFLLRFDADPDKMRLVVAPLAELGEVELLNLCLRRSDELGHAGIGVREFIVEAYLRRGEWNQVDPLLTEIRARRERFSLPPGQWQEYHETLLRALRDPARGAQNALVDFLQQLTPGADALERVAVLLEQADLSETTKQVRALARQLHPKEAARFPEPLERIPDAIRSGLQSDLESEGVFRPGTAPASDRVAPLLAPQAAESESPTTNQKDSPAPEVRSDSGLTTPPSPAPAL